MGKSVQDHDQGDAVDDGALEVESLSPARRPFPVQLPEGDTQNDDAHGDHGEKQAPPSQGMGHDAPQDRSQGKRNVNRGDVDADGLAPLIGGEHRGDDGQARDEDHSAGDSLEDPEQDERMGGSGNRGQKRRHGEQDDPVAEDPLHAVDVGDPAEGNGEHGRGQQK